MYDITLIIQKIIDVLKVDDEVKEPNVIRKYHYGEPTKKDRFPLAWVEFKGGRTGSETFGGPMHTHIYQVVVADQGHATDAAEKSVQGLAKKIDDVLKANTSLSGLVNDLQLVNTEAQTVFEGDFAKSAIRLSYQVTILEVLVL